MKGKSSLFGSPDSTGKWKTNIPHSGKSVRGGLLTKNHSHPHSLPMTSIPNSTIEQTDDQGKVIRIRHYDENGNAEGKFRKLDAYLLGAQLQYKF